MASEIEQGRCGATTKTGDPCGSLAMEGSDYCRGHDPNVDHVAAAGQGGHAAAARRDIRERFRRDATEAYELLIGTLRNAVTAVTTRWATCQNCNHRVAVSVPDVRTQIAAVELWMSLGFGKPTQPIRDETALEDVTLQKVVDLLPRPCLGYLESVLELRAVDESKRGRLHLSAAVRCRDEMVAWVAELEREVVSGSRPRHLSVVAEER